MKSPESPAVSPGRWTSLWVVALVSFVAQLTLCQFFSFGEKVPLSLDVNPSKLWTLAYHFPPTGTFQTLNWLGVAYPPQPLNPLSLAAHLSPWLFFTAYVPFISTLALLAMAVFLRELELARPSAIFGGVIYAWQGDILPFVYPGHYGYITMWPFLALAAWGALRVQRTNHWAYAVISGICCGIMVGLLTNADRGGIACLLVAALYLAPFLSKTQPGQTTAEIFAPLCHLALCVAVAVLVALAPLLSLYKSNIEDVKLSGVSDRELTYKLVTQFSLGPSETLTYLVPGFFGWHVNSADGPYWGWIGEWPDWPKTHQGTRNLNLAITTTGTVATLLALIGVLLLLPGEWMGPARLSDRQRLFTRLLLAVGFVALILSWGWHTPFYRPIFSFLPLMDKWRNPLKWAEVTNFALITLSALGVQHLLRSLAPDAPDTRVIRRRIAWITGIAFVLLLGGLGLSYPLAIVDAPGFQRDGFDPHVIPDMMSTMHTSLLWATLLVALFGVVLYALWRPGPFRQWSMPNPLLHRTWQAMFRTENLPLTLALAMAALGAVQLGWVATQFIVSWPMDALTETNPLLDTLREDTNTNHVRVSVATDDMMLNTLLQNQFAAMNISCLDISAASRIPDRLNAFFGAFSDSRARLWYLGGVKDVVMPQQLVTQMQQDPAVSANVAHAEGYVIAPTSSPDLPSHALVTMKDYLAKATFIPNADLLSSDDVLKRLKDSAWNPRDTILVEKPVTISAPPAVGPTATSDTVDLQTYSPTEIVINAKTSRSGFILINDGFDPDWQVQVNSHAEPLLRADYVLRAVAIPAGESRIEMDYVAHYHLAGLSLSATAVNFFSDTVMLAAWLIAGFALRKR